MKHRIDPKVDCVFKALLGAEDNRRLLIHFLNAMLHGELGTPIVEVEILNPYHEREFVSDKLSIVDVKARDQGQRQYQIEIQLLNVTGLPGRIAYGWADLYRSQLKKGDGYDQLKPAYSLWLLGEALWPQREGALHRFRLRDQEGRDLVEHGGIWLAELSKCVVGEVHTEQERWLKFFVEGEGLDEVRLPDWMQTQEMRQAMSTLQGFSDKERAYHRYQARQDYLRQQQSIENRMRALLAEAEQARAAEARERSEKEQERIEKEQERIEKEQARAAEQLERTEKEAALAEIARLKALLQDH
jgi:predicted transposase/invertase (TIGR01784 family)